MRLKNKRKNYSGMTIIEMIVAIGIFTLGTTGSAMLFSKVWQGNSYTLEMGQSAMKVSQGLNKMMDYIREASQSDNGSYAIALANDNELTLYSDYDKDGAIERMHFYKSGQSVLMGVTNPTDTMPKTYPAGDQETITLADYIMNDASTPIFYYYDRNYSGGEGQNPLSTPAVVSSVRLLKIYLKINIDPNRAPDNIEMQSFVELRNLNEYNQNE